MKLGRDVSWVKFYKNCSKNLIPFITLVAMATKRIKMQNLWKSSLKLDDIEFWYLVCSTSQWTYTKFVQMTPLGSKLALPRGVTSLNIETKKENFKIVFLWNWKAFDIWYAAFPSGPLLSLFKWCPWNQNWPRPMGHKFKHRNKEGKLHFFSSVKLEGLELWYLVCSIS